jgi:thioredoxin 1
MGAVLDVTDQSFEAEVLKSSQPVIIDFWAEWCGPCKQIAPVIKELAATWGDQVKIVKMNVDENASTPGKFGIRAIPTFLAFQNGKVVQQLQGARPKADFEAMIKKLLQK